MKFNLDKDLIFFDIEATGLDVTKDRIVQLAMIKYFADGRPEQERELLINPTIPISKEAEEVHGISNDEVADKPEFRDLVFDLFAFVGDADLAGYNSNRFDVPMLVEEFARAGRPIDMKSRRTLDMQTIFFKMEPRTLKAALKFYTGENMVGAHNALQDVKATIDVFKGQLDRYKGQSIEDSKGEIIENPVRNDMQAIHDFVTDPSLIDGTKRFRRDENGVIRINFGKYSGEIAKDHPQYLRWIIDKDFSYQTKLIAKELLKETK